MSIAGKIKHALACDWRTVSAVQYETVVGDKATEFTLVRERCPVCGKERDRRVEGHAPVE